MIWKNMYIFMFVFICLMSRGETGGPDNVGTEFVLSFCKLSSTIPGVFTDPELYISTLSSTPVLVTVTAPLWNTTFKIQVNVVRNTTQVVAVPYQIRPASNGVSNNVILVTASREITIQAINKEEYNMDAWTVYPVDALWNRYYVISYTMMPFFQVATVNPGITMVSVTFKEGPVVIDDVTYNASDVYTTGMKQYQVLNIIHDVLGDPDPPDFSGTSVVASQSVACTSGNVVTNVGDPFGSMDHIAEQLVPVETWGTIFALASTPTRKSGDTFRVYSQASNTSVTIYRKGRASNTQVLSDGDYHEYALDPAEYAILISNRAVALYHFANSYSDEAGSLFGGDPSLSYVPPLQQWAPQHLYSTPLGFPGVNNLRHLVNIIIDKKKTQGIRWNGWTLPRSVIWVDFPVVEGVPELAVTDMQIGAGYHVFYHIDPIVIFLIMEYGISPWGAYGTVMGSRAAPINMHCNETAIIPEDGLDNDCDGFIDEEHFNGIDDDGDGRVDEDLVKSSGVGAGGWSDWSSWSDCNCTSELMIRIRLCDNPKPERRGAPCMGNSTELMDCVCTTTTESTTTVTTTSTTTTTTSTTTTTTTTTTTSPPPTTRTTQRPTTVTYRNTQTYRITAAPSEAEVKGNNWPLSAAATTSVLAVVAFILALLAIVRSCITKNKVAASYDTYNVTAEVYSALSQPSNQTTQSDNSIFLTRSAFQRWGGEEHVM